MNVKTNIIKVKDIFKNNIEVTNLNDAIRQTEMFLSWSEESPNTFGEYKLIPATDSHGKATTVSRKIENGKEVTNIEFYSHLLKQLEKLKK